MGLKITRWIHDNSPLFGRAPVMKASLVISFFFHIMLLLAFQKAYPLYWPEEELRSYRVEIIRPPMEGTDPGDTPENRLDNLHPDDAPGADDTQETISLDTEDTRYVSYTQRIKQEIMQHWRYPPEARAYLMEGSLVILFSLARNGEMTGIDITSSSGNEILDQEVVRAIKKAAPFPRFPESIIVKKLNINARFEYRLSAKRK